MANATIIRKYYFVKYSELNTIPLREGNIIAISDGIGWYYDIGTPAGSGNNIERISVSAKYLYVQSLPDSGVINTIYILDTGRTLIGTNTAYFELYVWENEAWQCIANNSSDVNVTSLATDAQYYIAGSTLSTGTTGSLVKRSDVFVTDAGKISAKGFTGGPADNATNAVNAQIAQTANVARQDSSGNNIDSYIKSISANTSNATVTLTKGDGTTSNITTYVPPVMSVTGAGLVPQIPQDTTKNILSRDGWTELDVSELEADSAVHDSNGQEIVTTYIKGLSFDDANRRLTYTKGNDTTGNVTIPDTTYTDYSGPGNGHGLVPGSTSGDPQRYLNVSGSWDVIPQLTGATASTDGASGLTPAPLSADVDAYLKGDGTWSSLPVFDGASVGVVPVSASSNKYLYSDGTWVDLPEMQGATTTQAGTSGLVPAPTASDYGKFLNADGSWSDVNVPVFNSTTNGAVPAPVSADSNSCLTASGSWVVPTLNTTGTTDIADTATQITDTFAGDGTTTTFTLSYTPTSGTPVSVLIDGTSASGYTVSNNVLTFDTAPGLSTIEAKYSAPMSSVKMYIVSSPVQGAYNQTYTKNTAYVINGKLYSDDYEVVTSESTVDSSFTASAGLSILSNRCGSMFYITLDGTPYGAISADSNVATTTNTFKKTYALGKVGSNVASFKLEGNSITCDTAISANDAVSVSFNALINNQSDEDSSDEDSSDE